MLLSKYGRGLGLKRLQVLNKVMLSKLVASVYSVRDGILRFLRSLFISDVNLPRSNLIYLFVYEMSVSHFLEVFFLDNRRFGFN